MSAIIKLLLMYEHDNCPFSGNGKTMQKLILTLLFVPLFAVAADIRLSPEQSARAGIVTMPLTEMKRVGGLRLPAQVVVPSGQIEIIATSVPAMVTAVRVAYGEPVRKGQPLVSLQGGQLLELQSSYAAALAQARLATEKRSRDEALFSDGIIAQSRLSESRAAETQVQALAAEKRNALRLAGAAAPGSAGSLSGRAEIRAPFDGVVLEAAAQPGQHVDAMTPLMKLGRLSPLWLEIQASAGQSSGLSPGDLVTVPGCVTPARIILIAPQMQAASQSLLIRAELAKPAACIKPFQFLQVVVTPGQPLAAGAWQVPPASVTRHQDKAWIFVAAPNGYQPVEVGILEESAAMTTVSANLSADAQIAVKGVAALKATWLGLGAGE